MGVSAGGHAAEPAVSERARSFWPGFISDASTSRVCGREIQMFEDLVSSQQSRSTWCKSNSSTSLWIHAHVCVAGTQCKL